MRILALGGVEHPATEDRVELRPRLQAMGLLPRRTSRFTELALLGAATCLEAFEGTVPMQCSVYLGTGQGPVADTAELMRQIQVDGLPPLPISFINVSSNTGGFEIAGMLGLAGRNACISRGAGSFEAALELARADLAAGRVPMALAGGVDECVWPPAEHRRRLGVAPEATLAEGSHWLLLAPEGDGPAVGESAYLADRAALRSRLREHGAAGRVSAPMPVVERAKGLLDGAVIASGYDTASGGALIRALEDGDPPVLHVGAAGDGFCAVPVTP